MTDALPVIAQPVEKPAKHRSVPIASSLTHIPGYPKKLVIFQLPASPFWWVRYYSDGKILKRSTKTSEKKRAITAAKEFYDEINYRRHAGLPLSVSTNITFEYVANAAMEMQKARVNRNELTKMVHDNDEWRLAKHVMPFFRAYDVDKIDYFALELFLRKVSEGKLSQSM